MMILPVDDERQNREREIEGDHLAAAAAAAAHDSSTSDRDGTSDVVRKVLAGDEWVISHSGASQYTRPGGGVSACGIAALNCVRVVLGKEQDGLRGEALLHDLIGRDSAEEITSICAQWSSDSHLEVDEICKVPLFEMSLKLVSSSYSQPSFKQFKDLLEELQSGQATDKSAALVITRPPEIIACLKIVTTTTKPVFVIFDSHPRPKHPEGAGFIFNTSIDATALYLSGLLAVDDRLLEDRSMQWQAQLLANFSGHIFVSKSPRNHADLMQAVMDSSLALLALQGQCADLKYQNSLLTAENKRLETEIMEAEVQHLRELKVKSQTKSGPWQGITGIWNNQNAAAAAGAGPSRTKSDSKKLDKQQKRTLTDFPPTPDRTWWPKPSATPSSAPRHWNHQDLSYPSPQPLFLDSDFRQPPGSYTESPSTDKGRTSSILYSDGHNREPPGFYRDSPPTNNNNNNNGKAPAALGDSVADQDLAMAMQMQFEWDMSERMDVDKAAQRQREFEEEDNRLRREREELAKSAQALFTCVICMEEQPEDFVARLEQCEHAYCRDCIRDYIVSKIKEHRFPILCPICVAEKRDPGVVSQMLVQQVSIPDKDFAMFEELQMAAFSIILHCRKCKRSAFVDKQEYQEQKLLVCPLPGCNYVWCKACQQTILVSGPQHSCDGSSELKHLMKQQGWKYCPGCETPIQKESGCNHMTCMSPGCNVHFCYVCGKKIVQSSLAREIKDSITAHYSKCQLFEDPA